MSNQDLFEKDYLAAFPKPANPHLNHWDYAYRIWLQQAKRHEAELTAASTTIDNIEAALGDARDPNLSLYENVLKLRAKAEVRAVFSCPIGVADCHRNCGNYGCGN